MFDFLDQILASDTPVVPMPDTSKVSTSISNLDSSKVLDWSGLFGNDCKQSTAKEPTPSIQTVAVTEVSSSNIAQEPDMQSWSTVEANEKATDPLRALGPVSSIEKVKAWTKDNSRMLQDIVTVNNDGAYRDWDMKMVNPTLGQLQCKKQSMESTVMA